MSTYTGVTINVVQTYHNPNEGREIWNNNFNNVKSAIMSIAESSSDLSEIVSFDTSDPNLSGTTFNPDSGATENILYVSDVNASTWIYSGASYITYTSPTIDSTPFYLNGTTIDAGSNKTASISRTGNLIIGKTGTTNNLFGVYHSDGTLALGVTSVGTPVSYGKGGDTTNTIFGRNSFLANSGATEATAFGDRTLTNNTTGTNNTAFGARALTNNTTGSTNVAIGRYASFNNTIGGTNTSIGADSMFTQTTASGNVGVGYRSLFLNVSSIGNTALGYQSLYNSLSGWNTSTGYEAMRANTTGIQNTANGYRSMYLNTTGANNAAYGYQSLYSNTIGQNNVSVGFSALFGNTIGGNNVAVGVQSLNSNTSGVSNAAIGYQALFSNTTGTSNTAIGIEALFTQTTVSNNVGVGYRALFLNATGGGNTAVGYQSLKDSTIGLNTAVGFRALETTSTGSQNVALGHAAGFNNTIGANNVFVGYLAGSGITTGSGNVILGSNIPTLSSGLTNSLIIANGVGTIQLSANSSNQLFIPNAPQTGVTADSILVRTSTGEIKTVSQSSISSSGIVGIPNSSGAYTFYSTLQSAIDAASSGDTITLFTNITENTNTVVTLKNGVNINGNGFSYTHSFTGTSNTFQITANTKSNINNLNIVRSNSTGSSNVFTVVGATVTIDLIMYGSTITLSNTANGIESSPSAGISRVITGLVIYHNSSGIAFLGGGSEYLTCYNCEVFGTSGGCFTTCELINCYATNSGSGIIVNNGRIYQSRVRATGVGEAVRDTPIIDSSTIESNSNYSLYCPSLSTGIFRNSSFTATASLCVFSTGKFENCYISSLTNFALQPNLAQKITITNSTLESFAHNTITIGGLGSSLIEITGCKIINNYNNATNGNNIDMIATLTNTHIINNTFIVAHSSNKAIKSVTNTINYSGNNFRGMTTPIDANITQGISNTHDNQGNILL